MRWLEKDMALPGVIDITPGIRSLQIAFSTARCPISPRGSLR